MQNSEYKKCEIEAAVARVEIRLPLLFDSHSPSMTSIRKCEWQYVRAALNANYQFINGPNYFCNL